MNRGQHESLATTARDRSLFRGWRENRGVCIWCNRAFLYRRHYGATRKLCSAACGYALRIARNTSRRHYKTGSVRRLCPPKIRCWMCEGNFDNGRPLRERGVTRWPAR